MSSNFEEKAVLITGAARGLGFAMAAEFHARGAQVVLNDLDHDALKDAQQRLGGGPNFALSVADVSTVSGCQCAVDAVKTAFGRLDVLVNNAGVNIERPIEQWDEAHWDKHVNVILKGSFFCVRSAMGELRKNQGNVVNISSNLGVHAVKDNAGYCAAKGGLLNLTRALALDLAPEVRVNCLCPGVMNTELMRLCAQDSGDSRAYYSGYESYAPLGRISEPNEIAKAAVFLASDDAAFITGSVLSADGGGTAGWWPTQSVR